MNPLRTMLARPLAAVAVTVAAVGVSGLIATPAQAGALPLSCGPSIDTYSSPEDHGKFDPDGRGWVNLRYDAQVVEDGRTYNDVYYASGGGLQPGDTISLDWSDDGGVNWHPCHATVPSGWTTTHTKGVNWVPGRNFRLCLNIGSWKCTRWFNV